MNEPGNDLLEIVLRECARLAPEPLYPAAFAQGTGVARAPLDAALDHLRLGGLVRLTEWVQGRGQGYTATPEGTEVVRTPRLLERLRRDGVAPKPAAPPLQPVAAAERTTPWERGEAIRRVLLEAPRPTVTLTLIFVNVLVFLYGATLAQRDKVFEAYVYDFRKDRGAAQKVFQIQHDTGGLVYSDVIDRGQWWRLLSHAFVHGGGLHLLMNMYFLYAIGPLTEKIFGRPRYLALYLTGALGGGAGILLAGPAPPGAGEAVNVGASGALCGLLGSLIVWVLANREHLPPPLAAALTRSLFINVLLMVFISMLPGVSAAGHFGGGAAGAAYTLAFVWERYHPGWKRWLGLAGMVAVPLAALGVVALYAPGDGAEPAGDLTTLHIADEAAVNAYNEYASRLLSEDPALLFDDPIVNKALTAFRDARDKLNAAINFLENESPPVKNPQQVRDYVRAWRDFFAVFVDVLERRIEWNEAQRRNLMDQVREIKKLRDRSERGK